MNTQLSPVVTQSTFVAMPILAVMDELEFRNYVSHRVRNISFERMASWNFFSNIVQMEERYQAAMDAKQAIDGVLV